jgi:hypothetical protein
MNTEYKLCINCKHFKADQPDPKFQDEKRHQCWHEKNLIRQPEVSLVTGEKIAPKPPAFNIWNLEVMRAGSGYCGEAGLWYEAKTLPQMVNEAKEKAA